MSTSRDAVDPVPEPGLTQEEIVQRARDMIPVLRERQEECGAHRAAARRDQPRLRRGGLLPDPAAAALRRLRVRPADVHARGDRAGARLSGQRLDLHPDRRPRPHARGAVVRGGPDRHLRRRRRGPHAGPLPPGHGQPRPTAATASRARGTTSRAATRRPTSPSASCSATTRRPARWPPTSSASSTTTTARSSTTGTCSGCAAPAPSASSSRTSSSPSAVLSTRSSSSTRRPPRGARCTRPRSTARAASAGSSSGDRVGRHRHRLGRARPLRGEPAQAQDDGAAAHPDDRARPVPALLRRGLPVDRRRRVRAAAERLRLHGLGAASGRGRRSSTAATSTGACSCASSTARSSPTTP